MRSAAEGYVQAMAEHDLAHARTFIKASAASSEALLEWSDAWSSATGADCRGVICSASGVASTPEPSFLMRKSAGRWRVAGVVSFPSWGPGELLYGRALYDPATGRPAKAGIPSGTTYWVLDDKSNTSYLKVVRSGRQLRLFGRTPEVVRLYAEQFSCGAATFDADGLNVSGSAVTNSLPIYGSDDDYDIAGPVWRSGNLMLAMQLAQAWVWVDGDGGTRDLSQWRRSTWSRTGGSNWSQVQDLCSTRT